MNTKKQQENRKSALIWWREMTTFEKKAEINKWKNISTNIWLKEWQYEAIDSSSSAINTIYNELNPN